MLGSGAVSLVHFCVVVTLGRNVEWSIDGECSLMA